MRLSFLKHMLFCVIVLITIASCKKDPEVPSGAVQFIFGSYTGFCPSNCIDIYGMRNGKLYPANADQYSFGNNEFTFSDKALSQDKYILAQQLLNALPQVLRANPNTTYGCPNCRDQGGAHIQINENGKITKWLLDEPGANGQPKIDNYASKVLETIKKFK